MHSNILICCLLMVKNTIYKSVSKSFYGNYYVVSLYNIEGTCILLPLAMSFDAELNDICLYTIYKVLTSCNLIVKCMQY